MDSETEPVYPFRWDIAKRHQLGTLLSGPVATSYAGFGEDLIRASARVLSLSGDSDLYFVGRSLESMFDLLSGTLLHTSWTDRLQLLHFSSRHIHPTAIHKQYPEAIPSLRGYLAHVGLEPATLLRRSRPLCFIDVVSSGSTLESLITLLARWTENTHLAWKDVARQIRIVGITRREKSSPNTWRWWQHSDWTDVLHTGSIKNVSVPSRLYHYIADEQHKVSVSYPPSRWGHEDVRELSRDEETLKALRFAVALFDLGRTKQTRSYLASLLAANPAMRERWIRSLVMELRS